MKRRTSTLSQLMLLLCAAPCIAAEIPAASEISKVTVYQDRALVTRRAKVDLPQGQHFISFSGLPSELAEESLRAGGQGGSAVSILSVEVKRDFIPGETNPRLAQVLAELEKLENDMKEVQSRQASVAGQRSFIDAVRSFSAVQVPKDLQTRSVPATELGGLSQFILTSYQENGRAALDLEREIAAKTKEISAKQQEMYSLQSGQSQEKKTVLVAVESGSKTSLDIELSYQIHQAAWSLSYDAKVSPEKNTCELVSYGNVRQWTGEDWKDVALTLSSARPAIGGRMPELDPWYVDFFEIIPYAAEARNVLMKGRAKTSLMSTESSVMADAAMPMAAAPAPVEATWAQASVTQDLGSVTYTIQNTATVLSDNRAYKFPVSREHFKAMLDDEATPKLSPYAFLHSKVTNDKDHSLPAGPLNIFVNDDYVGTSQIPSVGIGESFDLYLGIDENVKVKRTELVDKKKRSLMGLRSRKDLAYKIEMENFHTKKISLKVYDQLPISKNQEIKVEMVSSSQKPSEIKDLGLYQWSFELEPREKKTLEFQFFVEHPADKNISGVS